MMTRNLALVISLAAIVLAGFTLFSSRQDRTPPPQQPEDSIARISKLEDRLDQLQGRLNDVLDHLEGSSLPPASHQDTGEPETAEEIRPGFPGEITRLESRMNELLYRMQALEEDPINRGYTYVTSENAELRRQGIAALRRFAPFDPAAREAIRNLLYDPNQRVRMEATDALGDLGDKEAAPLVAEMLSDSDPGVRREAIDSFADWGHREAAPLISRMLNDPDANVRREAIVALGTLGASEAAAEIAQLLSDSSDRVREQAADALGRLKAGQGTAALLQALSDSNDEVRGEAIASLGEIGAVQALPYLRDMYNRDPGRHRIRLVTALRSLGDAEPFRQEVQRLSQVALSGDDARARAQSVRSLSWFAREEARDVFRQALQDPSEWVRREAERALRRR